MTADDSMSTYKRADGELIAGEFGWVRDTEYFEDDDAPTLYIREDWVRTNYREVWIPDFTHCAECGEQVQLPENYDGLMDVFCADPECIAERRCSQQEAGGDRCVLLDHDDASAHCLSYDENPQLVDVCVCGRLRSAHYS